MQLVHLEPVEHAGLDRLDQVGRLERAPARSESQQTNDARSSTTLSSSREVPLFAPAAQTSAPGLQPLAAQDGIARGRDRDDDVLRRRIAVALGRLGADPLAERLQVRSRPAVGNDALDRRAPPRGCTPPGSPPACRTRSRRASLPPPRKVPRGDPACRSRAQPPEVVGLDDAPRAPDGRLRTARRRRPPRRRTRHRSSPPRSRARDPTLPCRPGALPPGSGVGAERSRPSPRPSAEKSPRRLRTRRQVRGSSRTSASVRKSVTSRVPPRKRESCRAGKPLHWPGFRAPVAQGIERCPAEAEVACSNHAGRTLACRDPPTSSAASSGTSVRT